MITVDPKVGAATVEAPKTEVGVVDVPRAEPKALFPKNDDVSVLGAEPKTEPPKIFVGGDGGTGDAGTFCMTGEQIFKPCRIESLGDVTEVVTGKAAAVVVVSFTKSTGFVC